MADHPTPADPIREALPPVPAHPEPHTMAWSALERAVIERYGAECAERALAQQPQAAGGAQRCRSALSALYHSLPDVLPSAMVERFRQKGKWSREVGAYALRGITGTVTYRADDMAELCAAMDEANDALSTPPAQQQEQSTPRPVSSELEAEIDAAVAAGRVTFAPGVVSEQPATSTEQEPREWLLELMGKHDFALPNLAFGALVRRLAAQPPAAPPEPAGIEALLDDWLDAAGAHAHPTTGELLPSVTRNDARQLVCAALAMHTKAPEPAEQLSAALGWPGGVSSPCLDWHELLRMVAQLRVKSAELPAAERVALAEEAKRLADEYAHCYSFVGDDTMPRRKAELHAAIDRLAAAQEGKHG